MSDTDESPSAATIFGQAVELPPNEREVFLDSVCAHDARLRARVVALVKADAEGEGCLDQPMSGEMLSEALREVIDESIPEEIGPYKIIGVLGRGGMAVVYLAEQDHPRREVALKLVPRELATRSVLGRFEHEADALARLNHPGIARVFGTGTAATEAGPRPYIAMERIEGVPLIEFAVVHDLSTRERFELLLRVCDAVRHAHTKGVIHRDLKPSNILVEESGQPKILDFGVARLTSGDGEPHTLHTSVGQVLGTLAYMSPEQAGGDPGEVDTRTDVYALGVVLYELLSGVRPHKLDQTPMPEAIRMLREDEPTRLSSINEVLRGDIETIVCTAMHKDRDRRYQSIAALGTDIEHYLRDEPIDARPASLGYLAGKLVKRHRVLVAAAAIVFVPIGAGVAALVWQGNAKRIETQKRLQTQAIIEEVVDPWSFSEDRSLESASAYHFVGRALLLNDLAVVAAQNLRSALEMRQALLGPDDPATLDTMYQLGLAQTASGLDWEQEQNSSELIGSGVDTLRECWTRSRRAQGDDDAFTLRVQSALGRALVDLGATRDVEESVRATRTTEGMALLEDLVERIPLESLTNPELPAAGYDLSYACYRSGDSPRSLEILRDELPRLVEHRGEDNRQTHEAVLLYADLMRGHTNDIEQAVTYYHWYNEISLRNFDPPTEVMLRVMQTEGRLLYDLGRVPESIGQFEQTIRLRDAVIGSVDNDTLATVSRLIAALMGAEQAEQAAIWADELGRRIERNSRGGNDSGGAATLEPFWYAAHTLKRGRAYSLAGRLEEAETCLLEALAKFECQDNDEWVRRTRAELSTLYERAGDQDRADEWRVLTGTSEGDGM